MLDVVGNSISNGKSSNQAGGGCLVLFGLIFAGFGLIFVFFISGQALKEAKAYLWEETPCKIESCEIKTQQGRDGGAFQLQVNYQYKFKGNSFTSTRYTLQEHWSDDYEKLALKRKELLHNAATICYVDPDNPANAVIKREGTSTGLMVLFPLIFVVIGISVLRSGLRGSRKRADRAMGAASREGGSFADAYRSGASEVRESAASQRSSMFRDRSFEQGISEDARVLNPGKKRLYGVLGILFFALFWNGIVSVFLVQVVKGFQSGKGEWFMALFLIPFVLVGLVVILVFLYQLLSLTNPKPVITLQPGIFRIGQTFEISWKIASNAQRIQHLEILLWGVESATYRRGTKTHTSREVFYVHSLFESTMHSDIRSGTVQFELPADVVPSLNTGNNAIEWELRVEGDIPRWPDIQDKYKIEVSR